MKLIRYIEGQSYLHKINPVIKAIGLLAVMIAVITSSSWLFIFFVFLVATLMMLGADIDVSIVGGLLKWLIAFSLFIILINYLFYKPYGSDISRFFYMSREGFYRGLFISLRIITVVFLSSMFVFTTDPTDFISALMQNIGLSPRIGFSILVALRTIPMFELDVERIKAAHRVRRYKPEGNLWNRLKFKILSVGLPLFVLAILRAERAAVAIAARGLSENRKRTFLRTWSVRMVDWIFLTVSFILSIVGVLTDIFEIT